MNVKMTTAQNHFNMGNVRYVVLLSNYFLVRSSLQV